MSYISPFLKFRSPNYIEKRHRKITKILAEELGNIPEEQVPYWAFGGTKKGDKISFDVVADYRNPSENNYNDWCKHIERIKETARKKNLKFYSTADYAALCDKSGKEALLITYSANSFTPDMVITNPEMMGLADECMQDFKKAV